MEWRSFAALKHGTRQVPRIEELERLARVLGVDAGFVFQVAGGTKAEEVAALLDREGRLRALLERLRDGVFTMDPLGRLLDCNPAMASLAGLDQAALLSRSLVDLCAPESIPEVLGALAAIARDGQVGDLELLLRRGSGETRTVRLDASRIVDGAGVFVGAQAIVRDVTVERVLALELERQRRTLQTIFDSVPAACILYESDGTISAANPLVERVCRHAAAEIIGRGDVEVFGRRREDVCPVTRAFRSGRTEQEVSWVENRLGQRVYVHRTAGPLVVEGKVTRVIELVVDVSDQIVRGDLRVLQLWRGHATTGEEATERRAWPRAEVAFPARLRHRRTTRPVVVENLSQDGLFLRTEELLPVGAEVEIEWTLPNERASVVARGVVVWHRRAQGQRPAGMGFRFLQLSPGPVQAAR